MRKSWQACDTLGDNCIISGVTWLEESFDLRIMAEWRMPTAQCVYKLGTSFVLFLEEEYILDYSMNSFNKKKRFSVFTVFRISAHTCIMQIVQKKKTYKFKKYYVINWHCWHSNKIFLVHEILIEGSTLSPVACVAGVRKGRGRELGRETAREGGGMRGTPASKPFSPSRLLIKK